MNTKQYLLAAMLIGLSLIQTTTGKEITLYNYADGPVYGLLGHKEGNEPNSTYIVDVILNLPPNAGGKATIANNSEGFYVLNKSAGTMFNAIDRDLSLPPTSKPVPGPTSYGDITVNQLAAAAFGNPLELLRYGVKYPAKWGTSPRFKSGGTLRTVKPLSGNIFYEQLPGVLAVPFTGNDASASKLSYMITGQTNTIGQRNLLRIDRSQ